MTLRPIRPMRELAPKKLDERDLGPRPELRWVNPCALLVDAKYQRDLTERSRRLIKRIIAEFAWRKWKPPIVVEVDGGLHCINGQHGAIAAATRGIPEVPIFVVTAATLAERAESFVAHNKDQLVMSPFDIFRARLAAGDEAAQDVQNVCQRAGVTLKVVNPQVPTKIGDCASISTVHGLVKRHGVQKARAILEALVRGGARPDRGRRDRRDRGGHGDGAPGNLGRGDGARDRGALRPRRGAGQNARGLRRQAAQARPVRGLHGAARQAGRGSQCGNRMNSSGEFWRRCRA